MATHEVQDPGERLNRALINIEARLIAYENALKLIATLPTWCQHQGVEIARETLKEADVQWGES